MSTCTPTPLGPAYPKTHNYIQSANQSSPLFCSLQADSSVVCNPKPSTIEWNFTNPATYYCKKIAGGSIRCYENKTDCK
jgi:hypothetical protein